MQFFEKLYTISFLFFLMSFNFFGQETSNQNYLVLQNGDTLVGEIQRIKRKRNSIKFLKKLHYKSDSGKKTKYSYDQITGFTIGEDIYRKYNLEQVSDLRIIKSYYRFVPYGGEETFLRVWLEGPLSHYEYEWIDGSDDELSRFSLLKLENSETLIKITQGLFGTRKKVLMDYFDSCPAMQEMINQSGSITAQEIVHFYYSNCL
jgi:hypothetical protein